MAITRVIPPLAAFLVLSLTSCAPHALRPEIPPPASGPFRTVTGDPTHPVCGPPKRRGLEGASPRCVVPFGRGTTAMGTSPDGTLLLIALLDVGPSAWRLPAVTFAGHLAPPAPEPGEDPHAEEEGPQAIAISSDAKTALLAVEDEILRYELATGRQIGAMEGPEGMGMVDEMAWSDDGRSLLIANAGDGKARLLDAGDGHVLRTLTIPGRAAELALDHAGRRAAVGTETGTVAIVDLQAKGAKPILLTPSTQEITGLRFVDTRLVTAARDGRVRIFDASTGKQLAEATVGPTLTRFAVSADGRLAAAAGDQNVVRVLSLPDGTVRATFAWHQASITALGWGVGPTLMVADNDGELAAWDVSTAEDPSRR